MKGSKNMAYIKRKELSAKIAYLIGVDESVMNKCYPDEIGKEINNNDNCSIVRCLCKLRTSLMKNFVSTDNEIWYNLKNLNSLSWFDTNDIKFLEKCGISIVKANYRSAQYMKYFCELIEKYIDSVKKIFPDWLNWEYIRSLFVVPNYNKSGVLIDEYNKFKGNKTLYPFSMYIYWQPFECKGMLLDDSIFLKSLYSLHNDKFEDKGKVIDVSSDTTSNIYDFIERSKKVVIAVDCENINVYKLFGFIKSLDKSESDKISKIVLYDDENTVETWKLLSNHIGIPTEYTPVERVLKNKSLVDIKMSVGICESHFKDNVDSFVIVSSDSDFWGTIESLPNANFMVVYENGKSSNVVLDKMESNNIVSCSLDDFYTGNVSKLKEDILIKLANDALSVIDVNLKGVMDIIYRNARISANDEEKTAFYNKYLKSIKVSVDSEGNLKLKVG